MTDISANRNGDLWIKAAAIGSIWASFEIVVGTFLHTLRIPFAGTFLTFFSVALLTAFTRRYPQRGLFWRSALVAALLRSVMPGAVIFGPLIAIVLEGLIFEAAVRLLGFRLPAYVAAGIAAMFSAIVHKVVSILILYGGDVVYMAKQLYFIFRKTTGIDAPPCQLAWMLAAVYVAAGTGAALLGMYAGKKEKDSKAGIPEVKWENDLKKNFALPENFRFHRREIWVHVILLAVFLVAMESMPFGRIWPALAAYETYLLWRYGKGMRRLAKPVFWFQLLIVLLLAVWLWDDKRAGFVTGLKMMLRALLLVTVFTAVGMELRNPLVYELIVRKGWTPLYRAVQTSVQILPALVAYLGRSGRYWIQPVRLMRRILQASEAVIRQVEKHYEES